MGLILVGGYYNKEKAIDILLRMQFHNSDFTENDSFDNLIRGIGIIGYLKIVEDKSHEDFLCEKMLAVKSVLDKSGDEAIDAYQELTSPKENELSDIKKFFPDEKWLADVLLMLVLLCLLV